MEITTEQKKDEFYSLNPFKNRIKQEKNGLILNQPLGWRSTLIYFWENTIFINLNQENSSTFFNDFYLSIKKHQQKIDFILEFDRNDCFELLKNSKYEQFQKIIILNPKNENLSKTLIDPIKYEFYPGMTKEDIIKIIELLILKSESNPNLNTLRNIKIPPKKILIIEPDQINAYYLTKCLKNCSEFDFKYEGDITNGFEAVNMAVKNQYDLVTANISIPGLTGIEVMRWIRNLPDYTTVPIVTVSSQAMKGDKEMFLELGFDDFIPMPFSEPEIQSFIKKIFFKEEKMRVLFSGKSVLVLKSTYFNNYYIEYIKRNYLNVFITESYEKIESVVENNQVDVAIIENLTPPLITLFKKRKIPVIKINAENTKTRVAEFKSKNVDVLVSPVHELDLLEVLYK